MFYGDRDLQDRAGIAHSLDVSEMTVRRHCEPAFVLLADGGAKMYDLDKAEECLTNVRRRSRRSPTSGDGQRRR